MDNVFIERLWRSVKYECLFLHDWAFGAEVRAGFGKWFNHYNSDRPHQAMDYQTPDEVYTGQKFEAWSWHKLHKIFLKQR